MRGFQPYLYSILRFPFWDLYHLVQANIGIVTFQYTFVLDYLMVIRASSFFICRQFLHCGFYTWQSGVTTLLLVLLTTRFMIKRLTEIIDSLSAIQAPAIWKTAWLLPFSGMGILIRQTFSPESCCSSACSSSATR